MPFKITTYASRGFASRIKDLTNLYAITSPDCSITYSVRTTTATNARQWAKENVGKNYQLWTIKKI